MVEFGGVWWFIKLERGDSIVVCGAWCSVYGGVRWSFIGRGGSVD